MDADDLRDYRDQDPSIHPTSSADLGTYARFLQGMPDYSDMTQEVFTKLQVLSETEKQVLNSLLQSTLLMQVQSTLLSKTY
jgi:hypothetical protein